MSKNRIGFHHSVTTLTQDKSGLNGPETHYTCEILYMISGFIEYVIGGKTYKLTAGDVIVLPPNTLHSLKIYHTMPYERMTLHFPPELLPTLKDLNIFSVVQSAESYGYVIPQYFVENSQIPNCFNDICTICREPDNKYVDLHFISAFISLLEELTETTDKLKALNDFKHSGIISNENVYACIQYIDNHLNEPLSVEKISHELKVSTSHLSHSFKKEIGIPIKKYITNQKLFLAQKLLQQGNSAQEVANSLGYEYYSTFYQQYVKRFRISPNDQATRPRIMLEDVKFDNGI